MKSFNFCLCTAVVCAYPLQTMANSYEHNLNFIIEDELSSMRNDFSLNHKITPLELNSLADLSSGVKFASVCSIVNETCFDVTFDHNEINPCMENGYNLESCPDGQRPSNYCPFDSKYFKECNCSDEYSYSQSLCENIFPNSKMGRNRCTNVGTIFSDSCICDTRKYPYTSSTCNGNEELAGELCKSSADINYAESCNCIGGDSKYKYTDATCKSAHSGFANWTINNDICQNKASDCVCTPSSGSCSEYTLNSDTCNGDYKIGESCNNGCQLKWKCKDLCPNKGSLTSCPTGYLCTLEKCSSKFYISGCAIGNVDVEQCSWYSCWINTFAK